MVVTFPGGEYQGCGVFSHPTDKSELKWNVIYICIYDEREGAWIGLEWSDVIWVVIYFSTGRGGREKSNTS